MKTLCASLLLAALWSAASLTAADKFTITVSHDLDTPRPAETITLPWTAVQKAIPGALLQKIAVKDATGQVLPYQVTNIDPEAKDPQGKGVAYGELIFQHDFAAGEKSATFTIEKTNTISPVFPAKVFARFVPERLDDFAWENDRIAHRTYGPTLAEPAPAGSNKEVLVTSGLDVWCKAVDYLVVDRWYNKGHDHYHKDEGEGMDMYQVGKSRGCGGTGVWDGKKLYTSRNYKTWKVIANGPIRAIFELTYEPWDANGVKVAEVKRFTVDAGHNLDQIDSTFTFDGAKEIVVAIGLIKDSADKGQDPKIEVGQNKAEGSLTQWCVQKTNGSLGTAIVLPGSTLEGFAEDSLNQLALTKATSGVPVRYYVGAGWTRSGQFPTKESWDAYVTDAAKRANAPIRVKVDE